MGLFKRLFGICDTQPPANPSCWTVDGKTLSIDLTQAPELKDKGGAIRLDGKGKLDSKVLVIHGQDGSFYAFSNKCTHGGRRIDPLPGESKIRCCSVGKTTFDYSGKMISGSGKGDLKTYPVEADEDKITIDLT